MAAGAWRIGALDAPRHRRWLAQDAARCGVRAVSSYMAAAVAYSPLESRTTGQGGTLVTGAQ
uniref:Uncharacterized protein n=1 Tax=Oryza glumipatula TaxID=40148 RepID=A0A0E0BH25_9ORYZ